MTTSETWASPLFELRAQLQSETELIGRAPEGIRTNLYVAGGEFSGRQLNGLLRRAGGDWFVLRQDGVGLLDVRCTLETSDGALIFGEHQGLLEFGEDGYEAALRGERPESVRGGVTARYHTGDARYAWINRCVCAGSIEVDLRRLEVSYRLFKL